MMIFFFISLLLQVLKGRKTQSTLSPYHPDWVCVRTAPEPNIDLMPGLTPDVHTFSRQPIPIPIQSSIPCAPCFLKDLNELDLGVFQQTPLRVESRLVEPDL